MRTGLLTGDDADHALGDTVTALLRVFMKSTVTVAGRYTLACGRHDVTANDMRNALMYSARTFFERDDQDLAQIVETERKCMVEEEEGEKKGVVSLNLDLS